METFLGKVEVIGNWCWWYNEKIGETFSDIISLKLGKNEKEIIKNKKK